MKKILAGISVGLGLVFGTFGMAQALPSTTSWADAGLQEMIRYSGPLSISVDGAGFTTQTGTIDVDKPAGATVIAAFFTTSATNGPSTAPTDVQLNGQAVAYSHVAYTSDGYFANYFSDVTDLVKSTIDAASTGIVHLDIDEGSSPGTWTIDGNELVVVFNDLSKPASSVIIMFGTSVTTGDSFELNFPALSNLNAQTATLSLGIGFSYQTDNSRDQQSNVNLSVSSDSTSRQLSVTAGSYDDGTDSNGALITVGGIGDSTDLPALDALANDDELYGLNSFLHVGDTSLNITTQNASGDDNLFQAVLYMEGVAVEGAERVGGDPVVDVTPSTAPELADTGVNQSAMFASLGLGFVLVAGGLVLGRIAKRKQH